MKITIPTIGTRGDVQPFIALAQGLQSAGHAVVLASHPLMRSLVESHGVAFTPIGPDIDLGVATADIRLRSGNVIVGLLRTMRFAFEMLESETPISWSPARVPTWLWFRPVVLRAATRPTY
ncbi:MAG: glycosyltransferase [Chloroflexota bacterium]